MTNAVVTFAGLGWIAGALLSAACAAAEARRSNFTEANLWLAISAVGFTLALVIIKIGDTA